MEARMTDLFSEEARRNPYPLYARLRDTPVVYLPAFKLWMVLDFDGVKRALGDHEAFTSNAAPARGGSFEWLLFMDPPRHDHLRAIVGRAFTPRSIAALEPRIRELTRALLQPALDRGAMELVADL